MRIVAHLGLMKTGTTTIQDTLRRNAERLHGRVAVVAYDDATAAVRACGQRFIQHGRPEGEAALHDALGALRARLERTGAPAAILSDENLYCRLVYSDAGDVLTWTRRALPLIADAFAGHDLVFAFHVRDPEAWSRSAWRQMVKRARCTLDFDAWLAGLPFQMDWTARFDELRAATGARIEVLDMDAEAAEGRLGAGLFRLAGLGTAEIGGIEWAPARNAALPDGAVEFMRTVNASRLPIKVVLAVSDLVEASSRHFVNADSLRCMAPDMRPHGNG